MTPAIAVVEGGQLPQARMNHSACSLGDRVVVYGGLDHSSKPIDDPAIWLYDTQKSTWEAVHPKSVRPSTRGNARLFAHGDNLILYGGKNEQGSALCDTWLFDFSTQTWSRLPEAPVSTSSAAYAAGSLYLIAATDNLSSAVHHLDITSHGDEPPTWDTVPFPTNPLTPGPRPRENGGLLHVTTGFGREYLLYFLGDRQPGSPTEAAAASDTSTPTSTSTPLQWSDTWSLQLPANPAGVQRSTTVSEAIKPAKIKDAIRSRLGFDVGTFSWAEVQVKPPGDMLEPEGKVHPGPRSSFGCDVLANKRDVVLWGGINARGEHEGDGWVIQLE